MHLELSVLAFADREAIFDYIEADSPQAALAVDNRIQAQVERLIQFPESGRPSRVEGTRELVIDHTPYIAAYRIDGDAVRILRLFAWCPDMATGIARRTVQARLLDRLTTNQSLPSIAERPAHTKRNKGDTSHFSFVMY